MVLMCLWHVLLQATASSTELTNVNGMGVGGGAAGPSSQAVLSLADAGDITGRAAVPESTIGGETTCIVCMARPSSSSRTTPSAASS